MTVYVVAQLSITDRAAYGRYQARFLDVLGRYSGRILAADGEPSVEEGDWAHQKVVLLEFPDRAGFRECADSPEYREIAVQRRAGASAVVLLVRGYG